jgi:hypothetical protein
VGQATNKQTRRTTKQEPNKQESKNQTSKKQPPNKQEQRTTMTDPAPPHGSNVKEDPQNNEPQETMYQSPLATESKPWTRILKSHASTVSEVNSVASSSETNSDENETETETGTSVVSGEPGFSLHGIGKNCIEYNTTLVFSLSHQKAAF